MNSRARRRSKRLWLSTAAALVLAGCTPPGGADAVVRYRQIGACNGTANIQAGSQAAFVLFQIDSIRNEGSTSFTFFPAQLFVTGPTQQKLSITSKILSKILIAPNAPAPSTTTVPPGQRVDFPPASFGVVTVATDLVDGAMEANRSSFFLNYGPGGLIGEKLNLARTVWPYTPDCAEIMPTLGQNAYADQAGQISTFKINPATGALSDLGQPVGDTFLSGDQDPGQFAIDPRGRFLFAMDSTVNEVLTYKINPANGALETGNMLAALTGNYPAGIVIDPAGRFLFVRTIDGVDAFQVDPMSGNGNLTKTGHIDATGIESFAVDGSGSFLYVLSSPFNEETIAAYAVDQSSGALSPVKNLPPAQVSLFGGLDFMTISPESGYLYLSDSHAQTLRTFQFDPTKPALTELSPAAPATTGAYSLTFDPGGGFLYVVNSVSTVSSFSVSATGALKPLATPATVNPLSIVAEPTGRVLYMKGFPAQTQTGYKLSSSNGALSQLPGAPLIVTGNLTIPGTY